jgi:response regulator RpfG family c-di-GMP phosphodiesterase
MSSGLVLLVDDEQKILSSLTRELFELEICDVVTAQSGPEGLEVLKNTPNVMVIISDYHMPGMDGIRFLGEAQKISPHSTRIMLTGAADLEMAIQAINVGRIFRFLIKPCSGEILISTIKAGIRQYLLITGEKELLQKTLNGSIKIMIDLLSALNPEIFLQASRLRDMAAKMAIELQLENTWEIDISALLCRIGSVAVPQEIINKWMQGYLLEDMEKQMIQSIPQVGESLIRNLPRFENVARGIGCQNNTFIRTEKGLGVLSGEQIPIIGRILKIIIDYDRYFELIQDTQKAFKELMDHARDYDPKLLAIFKEKVLEFQAEIERKPGKIIQSERKVNIEDLKPGMILKRNVIDKNGRLVVARGTVITDILRLRLGNYYWYQAITDPLVISETNSD